jgi:hypothetical protein
MLKMIYGHINDNGRYGTRDHNEIYKLCDDLGTIKVTKLGTMRSLRRLFCRKPTLQKPEGTRRVGKCKLWWLESVEEDLKNMNLRNWRRKKRVEDNFERVFYT